MVNYFQDYELNDFDILINNVLFLFLINMVYPLYWLVDPFYYLNLYQRDALEKKLINREMNKLQNAKFNKLDYSQRDLNT